MFRVLLLLFLFQAGPCAGEPKYVITLVPHNSTYRQWRYDWRSGEGFVASAQIWLTPPYIGSMEYAACLASHPERKWRFSATGTTFLGDIAKMTKGGSYGGGILFESPEDAAMDSLGDGTFLFAVLIDGARCSNVIRVTIRHDYDASVEPALRVFAIQPLRGKFIKEVGVWIVPPVFNQKFKNVETSNTEISVDGIWHSPRGNVWMGLEYPLKPGRSEVVACSFSGGDIPYANTDFYSPPVLPFQHAKVQARLFGYTSAVTDLYFDAKDSELFDHAFGLN